MSLRTSFTFWGLAVAALCGVLAGRAGATGFGGGRTYTATGPRAIIHAPAQRFYGGFGSGAPAAVPPVAWSYSPAQVAVRPAPVPVRMLPAGPVRYSRRGGLVALRRGRLR
jgi:hypothetical protein